MNDNKIYNLKQIETACIVGSPIAAGILIAHNYKTWNDNRKAISWILIGILWTVSIIAISLIIPEGKFDKSLSLLPFVNGVILYPIIKKYQGKQIEKHFENKGEKSSNWNVAGIVVLLVLVIMVPLIVLDQQSPINNFIRADFNGSGVLYNHEMSIEEVDKLGNILIRIDYFNSETPSEVVFVNCDTVLEVKLISDKNYFNDTEYLNEMQSVFKHISYYNFSKPVRFNLIDEYLKTEKRIELSQSDSIQYLMESVPFDRNKNFKLYYDIMIPEVERLKLQDLILRLNNLFPHQYQINYMCEIVNNSYILSIYIPKVHWNNPQLISDAKLLKTKLNQNDFSKPFRLRLYENTETNYEEFEIE